MVKIRHNEQEWELPHGMTVRDAMIKVGLDPQLTLALRDGKLVNEETITLQDEVIKLVSVISGG